jgi:hypothetical protein
MIPVQQLGKPPTLFNDLADYIKQSCASVIQLYTGEFYFPANKIIVLCYIGEYHLYSRIEELLCSSKLYHEKTGKLKNYYIFLSPHKYPESLKKEYGEYFTVFELPYLYSYYADKFNNIAVGTNKQRHFLSLNNRASTTRQSLYYFFEKFSLLDKSYFSYHGNLERTNFATHEEISNACINYGTPWYLKNLNLDKLNQQIPLKIAGDQFNKNDWSSGQDYYYTNTFCSVVTETYDSQPYPYFTEKTFKPIAFCHPFILSSNRCSLDALQDLGFQTFANFWDESYDQYEGNQRLEAMFHLILEIGNWSIEKINSMYTNMLPVLEHNQQHFFNILPKQFDAGKSSLYIEIKNIVNTKQGLLE